MSLPKASTIPGPLNDQQTQAALEENYSLDFIEKFPKIDRSGQGVVDPIYNNQVFALHSFVPVKGATPDKNGVFGFVKFRGTYATLDEANARAEFLVRNVDSYNPIFTSYVGRPFPIAVDTKKYVQETKEVDIRKQATESISEAIRKKKQEEKNDIEDIKQREKKLLEETGEFTEPDPYEKYTTIRSKKANLVWTFVETQKKMREYREKIFQAQAEIEQMEKENDDYEKQYMDRFYQARRDVGLTDDQIDDSNFIKFMIEDNVKNIDFYSI
jgi:hypothetical protein